MSYAYIHIPLIPFLRTTVENFKREVLTRNDALLRTLGDIDREKPSTRFQLQSLLTLPLKTVDLQFDCRLNENNRGDLEQQIY